jgi:hypothetical protein
MGCAVYPGSAVAIGHALYAGCLLAAWILELAKTAQIRRWGWFVAVLLTLPLGTHLYGLAGPTTKAAL